MLRCSKPKKKRGPAKKGGGSGGADGADDLFVDEEDRARLAKMSEFDREMVLAERAEARQQERQRQQLLAAAGGDDTKKPSTKRQNAARRSGREVREETAKKSAIEELKAARERKAQGRKAHAAKDLDVGDESSEEELAEGRGYEDESDLEEGEADGGPGGMRWAPRELDEADEGAAEEADLEELKSIQVRRHKLEEWISKPHFEVTMPGCMVRVAAGERRSPDGSSVLLDTSGRPVIRYMLVQVIGVEELPPGVHKYLETGSGWKSPYPFGPDGNKTSKWLRVSRGKTERIWPLAQVSNKSLTEEEYNSWHRSCEGTRQQVTRGDVAEVLERLKAADTYVYSAEDVANMLEEKRRKGQTTKNVALERARLERERDFAKETGDEVKLAEVEEEIRALEESAKAAVASRQSIAASMAELNKKNAERNFKSAFKTGKEAGGGGAGAAGTLDPFSRRATRTKNYWNTQRQQGGQMEGAEDALMEVELADAAAAAAAAEAAAASFVPELNLVDLSGLDLSLLDLPMKVAPIARKLLGSRAAVVNNRDVGVNAEGRATLSLEEYRRRNGWSH